MPLFPFPFVDPRFGYWPTDGLVNRLKAVQGSLQGLPGQVPAHWYRHTILTDRESYEIGSGAGRIIAVDRDFVTIMTSESPDSSKRETVYLRLRTIRAIQEHFDKE
jgi:hypothetical protein